MLDWKEQEKYQFGWRKTKIGLIEQAGHLSRAATNEQFSHWQ
jgi:hypothetical protein